MSEWINRWMNEWMNEWVINKIDKSMYTKEELDNYKLTKSRGVLLYQTLLSKECFDHDKNTTTSMMKI